MDLTEVHPIVGSSAGSYPWIGNNACSLQRLKSLQLAKPNVFQDATNITFKNRKTSLSPVHVHRDSSSAGVSRHPDLCVVVACKWSVP